MPIQDVSCYFALLDNKMIGIVDRERGVQLRGGSNECDLKSLYIALKQHVEIV